MTATATHLATAVAERYPELRKFIIDHGVKFRWDDGSGARADMSNWTITLGLVFLERLWARAFSYSVFYAEMAAEWNANQQATHFDPDGNAKRKAAGKLLRWALEGELSPFPRKLRWFGDCPSPSNDQGYTNEVLTANKIFSYATAFVQHHELCHLRFRHNPGCDRVDQERDADRAAAEWMLGQCEPSSDTFRDRAIGIVVALLTAASPQAYQPRATTTHPQPYDRLYYTLDQHVADPNHPAWSLAAMMLSLHLQHAGVPLPDTQDMTWKQIANEYVDTLSRVVRPNK